MHPKYLRAPSFQNRREFAYVLLENEDIFGYTVQEINGTTAIVTGCGLDIDFLGELIHDRNDMHNGLAAQGERGDRKSIWDNGKRAKSEGGKSQYTN